jgi:hypothetical protein
MRARRRPLLPFRLAVSHRGFAILGNLISEQPLAKATSLLVPRNFEARARIFVFPARTPGRTSPIPRRTSLAERVARLLFGFPEPATREPQQHGIWMPRLQLP